MSGHLCDGCNVREPFEHRCHGTDGAWRGDPACTCDCTNDPSPEEFEAWLRLLGQS